jgi:hypothetical protein
MNSNFWEDLFEKNKKCKLISWIRVLLQRIILAGLGNKFSTFNGTLSLFTVVNRGNTAPYPRSIYK